LRIKPATRWADHSIFNTPKTIYRRLRGIWEWLILPSNTVQRTDIIQQSRLLAAMLIVTIVLGLLVETLTILFGGNQGFYIHLIIFGVIFLLGLAYLINRSGRMDAAVWISIAVQSFGIIFLTFHTEGQPLDVDFLNFLFLPLLFASVFVSAKIVILLGIFYIGAMISSSFIPGINSTQVLLGPTPFVAIVTGLIYLIIHQRGILEAGRQRELVDKEERYRTLFEGANDAIFLLNFEDIHIAVNQKAADMLGFTVSELVGQNIRNVIAQHELSDSMNIKKALLAGDTIHRYERTFRKKSGMEFPAEINVTLVRDRNGAPYCIQSIVRDITTRKQTEARMQSQLDRLKALREIDRMINTSLDLQTTLSVLIDHVVAQLEVDAADILLLDPYIYQLDYSVIRGYHTGSFRQDPIRLDEKLAGRAVCEMQLVQILDLNSTASNTSRLQHLAAQGFKAGFAVPLIAKGMVKGVLEVFFRERSQPFEPSPEWADFLETLAGQAAIAVESAELFENLQRSNMDLILSYDATLEGWAKALELRDKETEGHSQKVTEMAMRLGHALGIDDAEVVHLRRGALLHDIGKMGIPDSILLKPGPLAEDEWEAMKQHPVYAYHMLSSIPFLRHALDIPYCHHEKWDGSGYPRGLKGNQIPLAARVFAVVDVWDALRSDRPYRPAWPEEKVLVYMQEQSGKHFDPSVVGTFLGLLSEETIDRSAQAHP